MNAPTASLKDNVEAFLFRAARALDAGDLRSWLAMCDPAITYRVTTVLSDERAYPVGLIDDNYIGLESRIESIERFWHAEEPRTQTLHLISNVEVIEHDPARVVVASGFQLCATRRGRQSVLYGRYNDELAIAGDGLVFLRRVAVLESNTLTDGKISYIV